MKLKGKLFIRFLSAIILFVFLNVNLVWGQNVKIIEEIEFSPESLESQLPVEARSFCVTEDDLFIIPDYKAGNIKLYEKNESVLEWADTIGRKGYGPEELSKPTICFYSKEDSKFVLMDLGIRKIFIYDRIGRREFKRVKEISCWRGGFDIQLKGNKLFISGYASDQSKKHYDFYYIDTTIDDEKDLNQKKFLLPSYLKFGLKSSREFEIKLFENLKLPAIGVKGWFDIQNDDAYFLWEGDLKVIKLNIVSLSSETEVHTFGKQPSHYVKPMATNNLVDNIRKNKVDLIRAERSQWSYGRNIFVSSRYVIVIYEGPVLHGNVSDIWLQLYTLGGDFVKEELLEELRLENHNIKMWFDKNEAILYFLSNKTNENGKYSNILKYKIYE